MAVTVTLSCQLQLILKLMTMGRVSFELEKTSASNDALEDADGKMGEA